MLSAWNLNQLFPCYFVSNNITGMLSIFVKSTVSKSQSIISSVQTQGLPRDDVFNITADQPMCLQASEEKTTTTFKQTRRELASFRTWLMNIMVSFCDIPHTDAITQHIFPQTIPGGCQVSGVILLLSVDLPEKPFSAKWFRFDLCLIWCSLLPYVLCHCQCIYLPGNWFSLFVYPSQFAYLSDMTCSLFKALEVWHIFLWPLAYNKLNICH